MSNLPARNPLLEPQREKAGAETFSKYEYQYHWALYRILREHDRKNEYAVFVEYHEDVVLANSLDASKARFEFNQIKTIDRVFTINELTKVKKSKKEGVDKAESEKSVLGKLLDSCNKKSYSHLIDEINLVSVRGFKLSMKNPSFRFDKIVLDDVDNTDIEAIEAKLREQLICEELPVNLQFVIPEVPESGFQNFVLGELSAMLHRMFPSETYNPYDIFTLLYDELKRIGTNTYDYSKWSDLIDKKSLTSNTVTAVINQFKRPINESNPEKAFDEIVNELGCNFLRKNKLRKHFNRYRQSRIGKKDFLQLETTQSIKILLQNNLDKCDENIQILINLVVQNLSARITQQFTSDDHLISAVMCEYIMLENYD